MACENPAFKGAIVAVFLAASKVQQHSANNHGNITETFEQLAHKIVPATMSISFEPTTDFLPSCQPKQPWKSLIRRTASYASYSFHVGYVSRFLNVGKSPGQFDRSG
jgi:hypothetical protein